MLGILFFGIIIGYILFVKFAVTKIYEYTEDKIVRNIALTIFILIPTWDIILGYPIYKYLCWTQAGVHVYKTVDNVEGFYVGKRDSEFEPYEPYSGYKYIDYKEINHYKPTGKYFRSYWIDNNTSKNCIHYGKYKFSDYADAYRSGKCIVKKEIPKGEVSRWEYNRDKGIEKLIIPIVNIYEFKTVIKDRKKDQIIAEHISYSLDNNWFMGFISNITSSKGEWSSCGAIKNMLRETLKPKQEGK